MAEHLHVVRHGWTNGHGQPVSEELRQERAQAQWLEERLTELEQQLVEDHEWRRLSSGAVDREFSRDALRRIASISRLYWIKNPLIRRAVNLRYFYVHGQGVQLQSADQDVNDVWQDFMSDRDNQRELFGHQATELKARTLHTEGNIFLVLITHPRTGRVRLKSIPFDEVTNVISDPDDERQPRLYRRQWTRTAGDVESGQVEHPEVAYYPDASYRPPGRQRRDSIGGHPVLWDKPVMHIKVGALDRMTFGIPDVYASLDWAKAYKVFLEDWASLIKSLSKFAYKATTTRTKRSSVASTLGTMDTDDSGRISKDERAGRTIVGDDKFRIESIGKSGATIDSESGKPLAAMAAAGMDVPVTLLLSDPGVTGARAVAETLDLPTRLAAENRQQLWTSVYKRLHEYVIHEQVKAPGGDLRGTVVRDEWGREQVNTNFDDSLEVDWPSLEEGDTKDLVEAIVAADQSQRVPPKWVATQLLTVLGADDVDAVMEELVDEDGRWIGPEVNAGDAIMDRFRRGETDPTQFQREGA